MNNPGLVVPMSACITSAQQGDYTICGHKHTWDPVYIQSVE